MKTLPHEPYLKNIVAEYRRQYGIPDYKLIASDQYREWLRQFGFKVPADFHILEFPDDFPDEELTMFVLRWS